MARPQLSTQRRGDDSVKDNRLYGKFTLDFPDSHKVMPLSDKAFRCLVEATLWSRKNMLDGFLPSRYAVAKWGLETLEELASNDPVKPSLETMENGWFIRDYAEHQDTKEEIEARSKRAKTNGQKGGEAKAKRTAKQTAKQVASELVSKPLAERERHISTSRQNSTSPDPDRIDVKRLVTTLVEALEARGVKTPGSLTAWNTAARRLLDIDKRPLDEALRVLAWSQQDDFWSKNILAMPKFRSQYDQLRLKADVWQAPVGAGERLKAAWREGFDRELSQLASEPFYVEWPDPVPADRDGYKLKAWRTWLESRHDELLHKLESRAS